MAYKNYQGARDAAWKILIDCGAKTLPISVGRVCKLLGIKLHTYRRSETILQLVGLLPLTAQTDGFCQFVNGAFHIFFDDTLPIPRQRFTVAHEIGHIVLGHIHADCSRINRDPAPGDSPIETQANQFAARLLAPACVLHELGALNPDDIAALCNISAAASRFRAERMAVLEQRNRYYTSPLERQVLTQFDEFIKSHNQTHPQDHHISY